jgi:hypothetical protein
MLNFLKKKDENAPPDVGQEENVEYKEETDNSLDNLSYPAYEEVSEKPTARKKRNGKNPPPLPRFASQQIPQSFSENMSNLELEKINARLELINSMIKSFNERFSLMNQQIGEIRTMSVANEKNLSLSNLDARKVIEIVKEVNPEKLRLDYRRADFKINNLSEKLESNKQFSESIMEELKELKRRANLFEGTDALLKLNEDVKKDLIEIQKTNSRVRMNADKSEQIFIELSKGFQENQKMNQIIMNLDTSYSGIKKEIEKLNIDNKQILNVNDFNDFKKIIDGKFIILENAFSNMGNLKEESDKLSKMIERILFMEKRNEEDIANIGLNSGNSDVKRISDYEKELFSFLELMDKMALEINRIKEKIGLKTTNSEKLLSSESVREKYFGNRLGEKENSLPAFEENWEKKSGLNAPEEDTSFNENPIEGRGGVNDLLSKGENCLTNGDLAGAVRIYEEISELYSPAEDEDNLIYPKIIKFYEHLSGLVNQPILPPVNYNSRTPGAFPRGGRQYKKLNDY